MAERNAIIINLGGLNAACLGCYGNGYIGTPTLDRLAAEGFVFDQCFADGPCPLAARQAWWTGRHQFLEPAPPGGDGLQPGQHAAVPRPSLANLLWLNGIDTTLIRVSCGIGGDACQQDSDFVHAIEVDVKPPATIKPLFDVAQRWLRQHGDKGPFLLFLDCRGANGLLNPSDAHEQAITQLDAQVGSFLDGLRGSDVCGDTPIVVTSDVGQPTGETAVAGAGRSPLHEDRVHVPLILSWPGVTEPASRSHALVEAVDLMPTLLDVFGAAVPLHIDGRSLVPIVRFEQRKLRDHAMMGIAGRELAVRTAEWHLIVPQSAPDPDMAPVAEPQLYVKPDDRCERNDVARQFPDVVEQLKRLLQLTRPSHLPQAGNSIGLA
jgi:arylsulfatase A-like enzyme